MLIVIANIKLKLKDLCTTFGLGLKSEPEPGLDLNVPHCGIDSIKMDKTINTGVFFHSASSCSSHHLTAYQKPRGSRRGYWPSLPPREMPPRLKMATIPSQRETPTYEAPVVMCVGKTRGFWFHPRLTAPLPPSQRHTQQGKIQ